MSNIIIAQDGITVNPIEKNEASGFPHSFDTGYAIAYGLEEAIMIKHFQFFITANANRGLNFHEGRFWTFDRLEDFVKHFPYWSVKQVRRILNSLISQGVIIKNEFNRYWSNRTQWYAFNNQQSFIRTANTTSPPEKTEFSPGESDLPKWADPKTPNGKNRNAQMGNSIYDTSSNTSTNSSNTSYKVPKEPAAGAAKPADAGDDGLDKSSKTKRLKADYSPKVQEVAAQFLSILAKNSDVYRAPKDTGAILEVVRQLIETDKQTPEELYKLLDYAAGDREQRGDFKGWSMMIYHKDGIKKFRSKLATIHSSMRSKPKRKFAPSSDDNQALKNMQEMWDNAL